MMRIKNLIMPYMVLFVTGEQPLGLGTHAQIFQMYRYESLSLSLSLSLSSLFVVVVVVVVAKYSH